MKRFRAGNLVRVGVANNWTLTAVISGDTAPFMREVPLSSLEDYKAPSIRKKFKNIEGKLLLIVYVAMNKLEQPMGYRVLLEGHEVFCKAIVAHKYFNLVENQGDESR